LQRNLEKKRPKTAMKTDIPIRGYLQGLRLKKKVFNLIIPLLL
jgi:hypothetical protein